MQYLWFLYDLIFGWPQLDPVILVGPSNLSYSVILSGELLVVAQTRLHWSLFAVCLCCSCFLLVFSPMREILICTETKVPFLLSSLMTICSDSLYLQSLKVKECILPNLTKLSFKGVRGDERWFSCGHKDFGIESQQEHFPKASPPSHPCQTGLNHLPYFSEETFTTYSCLLLPPQHTVEGHGWIYFDISSWKPRWKKCPLFLFPFHGRDTWLASENERVAGKKWGCLRTTLPL